MHHTFGRWWVREVGDKELPKHSRRPKRRGPKSHGASRPTPASARLEKKLDDLMSLMRLQQAPANFTSVSPQLPEAGHDDDGGNETSPTLTNNTPSAFQPETYADEPSLEEAEATFRRFRDEMVLFGSMVSQIAVALIQDLGLNMTPPEYPSKVGQLLNGKGFGLLPQIRKERTMEDRRALIGAYIITSITKPHDHILITQAKLQLIINRLRSAYRGSSNVQVPAIYSDALRSELDSLLTLTDGVSNIFDNNLSHDKDIQNFAYYQRVVNSLRSWLDLYFSIPLDHLRFLPASNYSQLYYVTVFIYRISALKVPTWNSLLAEAGAELVPVLDTVIQRFEQAALSMPDSQSDQAFLLGIHKFSALKAVFKSEFVSGIGGENGISLLPQDTFMSMAEADFSPFLMDPAMFPMMQDIFDDIPWQ
ncbi:unnamed protein product [Clonostachys rhizophaga]|uniref:Uncharacterized protein n=1 Tax=Clonostachys rhizophaga TaxID=160324 RepID=A0A9N9YTC0_9HYPO|nr:unnamed protein product [Clonostachys rhizophaga]